MERNDLWVTTSQTSGALPPLTPKLLFCAHKILDGATRLVARFPLLCLAKPAFGISTLPPQIPQVEVSVGQPTATAILDRAKSTQLPEVIS